MAHYGRSMTTVRRKDLKPAKRQSDAEFLRRAAASAQRAEAAKARARRVEQGEAYARRHQP